METIRRRLMDGVYFTYLQERKFKTNVLSAQMVVPLDRRTAAGNALLSIAPGLLVDQINEIVIDLTRELESGQEQISRFIPPYLGRLLCQLPEKELHESVESIGALACGASIRPARVALFTLGEALNVLPMGAGLHVQLRCGEVRFLIVLTNHSGVQPGDTLALRVDPWNIQVFDAQTERNLCCPVRKEDAQ